MPKGGRLLGSLGGEVIDKASQHAGNKGSLSRPGGLSGQQLYQTSKAALHGIY